MPALAGLRQGTGRTRQAVGGRHRAGDGTRGLASGDQSHREIAFAGPRREREANSPTPRSGFIPSSGTFCQLGPGAASRPGARPAVGKDGPAGGHRARARAAARRRTLASLSGSRRDDRDAVLAERGWRSLHAEKTAEADAVFARLLATYPGQPVRRRRPLQSGRVGQRQSRNTRRRPTAKSAGRREQTAAAPLTPPRYPSRRLMPAVLYRLGRTRSSEGLGGWRAARSIVCSRVPREPAIGAMRVPLGERPCSLAMPPRRGQPGDCAE